MNLNRSGFSGDLFGWEPTSSLGVGFPPHDGGPVWTFSTPWDQLFTYGFAAGERRVPVTNEMGTQMSAGRGLSPVLQQLRAVRRHLASRSIPTLRSHRAGAGREEVREIIVGEYRIVYRVESDAVLLLTIFRSSRLFPTSLSGLE